MAKSRSAEYKNDESNGEASLEERVVSINRCSKVVKGGRNFSFSALVVVGDKAGNVGVGFGKANEISDAIKKGGELAKRGMFRVPLVKGTIPHEVEAKYRGGRVLIRPASPGTGLIAGGAMRAVLDLAGVSDILAKSLGSDNPVNVIKATVKAIGMLETRADVMERRGLSMAEA